MIITRREFCRSLKNLGAETLVYGIVPPSFFRPDTTVDLSKENLTDPVINPSLSITNISIIPESLCPAEIVPLRKVNVRMALNFKESFDANSPDLYNYDKYSGGDLGIYGNGVREAIQRNDPRQKVKLVLDFPGATDHIDLDTWKKYVATVIKLFKGVNAMILGNEINVPGNRWGQNMEEFADYYLAAAETIQTISPATQTLMYGEAYFGDQSVLRNVLHAISQKTVRLDQMVQGLCFHFYDHASLLRDWALDIQKVALDFGLLPKLHLTELSKLEGMAGANITDQEHQDAVVQLTATALALKEEELVEDIFWHTAYSPTLQDPYHHSLTRYDISDDLHITPAFGSFWKIAKLLYKNVRMFSLIEGITLVSGTSSNGNRTVIVWNKSSEPINVPKIGILNPSIKPDVLEGKPIIKIFE